MEFGIQKKTINKLINLVLRFYNINTFMEVIFLKKSFDLDVIGNDDQN